MKERKFKEDETGTIPEDWDIKKLDEIKSSEPRAIAMGPFGSNIRKENYKETGVPVIRGFNLKVERFLDENFVFLSEEKAEELTGSSAFPEDIIFVAQGGVGQVGIILRDAKYKRYILSQNLMKISCDKEKADPFFVFYFFRSKRGQDEILSYVNPTGVPCVSQPLSSLKLFRTPYPNLDEQHEIAKILSSLDEKIEIDQKINLSLEKIGQALFKHWFINFEFPNEDGKPYKSSGGEMIDSELGEIPKGWDIGGLEEFCDIIMGQSPPGHTYNEVSNGLPFYQGITDFGFRFPSRRVYCTEPTRVADEGDILLSVRAPVGSLNVAGERCAIGRGVAALRLKGGQNGFLYYLLRSTQSGWETFEAEGTVFGSVNKSGVRDFKVIIPPKFLRDSFGSLVKSFDEQILVNERQSRNLAAIRDSLLPKLMSGKIRVGMAK